MTKRFLLCLLLVDLPVIATVLAVGWFHGYANTYWAIEDWRMTHPWSFAPSLVLAVVLARRWQRSRGTV